MRTRTISAALLLALAFFQLAIPAQQIIPPGAGKAMMSVVGQPKQFDAKYFTPTNPKLEPIPTIPFTAEEFIKFAPDRIVPGTGAAPQVMVRRWIDKEKKYVLVNVPLNKYVAEVNQYEGYLNQLGHTLRDGKLNKSNPSDTQVQSNLGSILKLRNRKDVENDYKKPLDELWLDPNELSIFLPHDPNVRGSGGIKTNPGDVRARAQVPGYTDLSKARNYQFQAGATRNLRVSTNPLTGWQRVLKVSQGDLPPCDMPSTPSSGGVGLNPICYSHEPCSKTGPGKGATGSEEEEGASFCPGTEKTSNDPKCLYDGAMNTGTVPVLTIKNNAAGGNGWFDAFVGVDLLSNIKQEGTKLAITNSGKASAGISVLGYDLKLLTASGEAKYQSGLNPAHTSSVGLFANLPSGPVPLTSKKEFNINLFQTWFMAGPVPISISAFLNLNMGLKDQPAPFVAPPLACGAANAGELTMFLGAQVYADVALQAAVDAVVASAGMDAHLILVNDSFGANLKTEVTPSTNTVKVTPSMILTMQHLAGKVYLFVELDLLVYSKRWSLTIFESDGIGGPSKPITYPKNPKTYVLASKKKS